MRALASLPRDEASAIVGLLFDLDDTLLSHGRLTREAYDALWSLHDAKIRLVAVTGRPAGWGEVLVRQWPIDAAVTENGAIVLVREGKSVRSLDSVSDDERRSRRVRLARIVEAARAVVPEVRLTDDVGARRADVTWDVGESVRVAEDRVALLEQVILQHGARTTRSSVHVHATYDGDDKASGALRFLTRFLGEDAGAARTRWAFIGDSGNDRACFSAFRTTFGVANVAASLGSLAIPPRYLATEPMGSGFTEVAAAILAGRAVSG